jgi:hypothetical protein
MMIVLLIGDFAVNSRNLHHRKRVVVGEDHVQSKNWLLQVENASNIEREYEPTQIWHGSVTLLAEFQPVLKALTLKLKTSWSFFDYIAGYDSINSNK